MSARGYAIRTRPDGNALSVQYGLSDQSRPKDSQEILKRRPGADQKRLQSSNRKLAHTPQQMTLDNLACVPGPLVA